VNAGGTAGYSYTTASTFGNGPVNWFSTNQSGSTLSVTANLSSFATLSSPTTYSGSITITGTGPNPLPASQTFTVSITVNPQPNFTTTTLTPFTVVNSYPVSVAPAQTVTVSTTSVPGVPFTVTTSYNNGTGWLVATPSAGSTTSASTPGTITVSPAASASSLAPGTYFASLAITAPSATSPTVVVPVTLIVNPEVTLAVTGSVSFAHTQIFTSPAGTATLNVTTTDGLTPATPATFTVTGTSNAGTPSGLLNIVTTGGTTTGTGVSTPVTISYSKAIADVTAPGTYGGTITVTVTGAGVTTAPQSVTVPWSIVISAQPVIQATPTSLSFQNNYNVTTIQTSSINVNSTPGVPYTALVTSSNGGNWLTITSGASGTTGPSASIGISINPAPTSNSGTPLVAGTYTGAITVTGPLAANSPVTIPVTFIVLPPVIQANPTSLLFNTATTASQTVSFVTNGANATITSAAASSVPAGWLTVVAPANTGTASTVSVNAAGLAPGTYTGVVQYFLTGAFNATIILPVTLVVPPPPVCTITLGNGSPSITISATGTSTAGLYPSVPASLTVSEGGSCGSGTWTATSNVPWLTIVSGSGTGNGSLSYNAFTNANSTARTGIITVSMGSVTATVSILEPVTGFSQTERQIYALYQNVLGREPDSAGLTYWLSQGSLALGTMAAEFESSTEGMDTNWLTLEIYQAINGGSTFASFPGGLAVVRGGNASTLFASLLAASACSSSSQQTVECLYENLLARPPSQTELTAGSALAPYTLFTNIINGNEFQNKGSFAGGPDHTNGLYITMLYYTILNRAPDSGGFTYWVGVANSIGGPGIYYNSPAAQDQIVGNGTANSGFVYSAEFQSDYQ
jgi:hypothetical protein